MKATYTTYFFAEYDVEKVPTAELWQLNSITQLLYLRLGSESSNFLDFMP